jgi:hypothetical protein
LETETSFRVLFWKSIVFQKRKLVSVSYFEQAETETSFRFLFWKR